MYSKLFTIILVVSSIGLSAQCPDNIDFEMGNFTSWQCFSGQTYTSGSANIIDLQPSNPIPNRHEIVHANADGSIPLDPYGRFPVLCPYGGKNSVKLGNDNSGGQAEGISCTFMVPNMIDTFTITYFYAVVFQDPNHSQQEQPRFFVTAYETATKIPINCASYNYVSTTNLPGFKQSSPGSDILYKEWSPVSIQFINLSNKEVTLEFKSADCTLGAHFGYAYLDVGSGCSNILATAPYCVATNSLQLNAPYGFQFYTWYNEDFSQVMGTDQLLNLNPPPVTSGKFWVDMEPYPGYGCRDTASAIVIPYPVPDTPVAISEYHYCQNQNASLLSATASINCQLLWYTDTTKAPSFDPLDPSTRNIGVTEYYVSQKILFGCESRKKKIKVYVYPVPVLNLSLSDNEQCLVGNSLIARSFSSNLFNPLYIWDFGDGFTQAGSVDTALHSYTVSGVFPVTLTIANNSYCSASRSLPATIVPPPIADFSYPPVICENETQLVLTDQSSTSLSTIDQWNWDVNGQFFNVKDPSLGLQTGGDLPVSLTVTSKAGYISLPLQETLRIRYQPEALFSMDTPFCNNKYINFIDRSFLPAGAAGENVSGWYWQYDNLSFTTQNFSYLSASGPYTVSLTVNSNFGCTSLRKDSMIIVNIAPQANLYINDSCVNRKIVYTATDQLSNVHKWLWDFGDGAKENKPVLIKYFEEDGVNSFILYGRSIEGCVDTIIRPFRIYKNYAYTIKDTIVAFNQPLELNANGGTNNKYKWYPSLGLSSDTVEKPIATYPRSMVYKMDALTGEGCDAHSSISVVRMTGPEIFIPTAFTPNGDNLNDVLKAIPVGMRSLDYFAVYDIYGQRVFYTTDFDEGWDGKIKNTPAQSGTYVAVAYAVDFQGNHVKKNTTVVLIR